MSCNGEKKHKEQIINNIDTMHTKSMSKEKSGTQGDFCRETFNGHSLVLHLNFKKSYR